MPRHYVDNAQNRSLGRVGMEHGSAVHSRSSYSSGNYSTGASSSPRVYVDNAQNRSLGRVGMEHGSAVHSRSSYSSGNYSTGASSSPGVYVDNAQNRGLGRVGLPLGSAVNSRSSYSSGNYSTCASSSPGVYVDNAQNRSLGRVGLPLGSAVNSKSSQSSYSSPSTYVDNALNRRLGRVGLDKGTAIYSKSEDKIKYAPKTYVDNAYNRKLDRVGLPLGSAVNSKASAVSSVGNAMAKTYVDNAMNRRLGRVGKPLGSFPVSKLKCNPKLFDFNLNDCPYMEEEIYENYSDYVCEEIENLNNLKQVKRDVIPKNNIKYELKPEQNIPFIDLDLGAKIGSGGFGDVHIALWNGQQVAVKKLRVQRVHQTKKIQFEDEVRSLMDLDHPNIVKFYGACIATPNLALVMEFLPDGSLYDNLYYSEVVQFDEKTKNQFICDFFAALKYIHAKNMVHRDIKSKNIMLCDHRSHCKLADFGLALKDDTESNASTKQFGFAGTEKYCPKEVLEGERLTIDQLKSVDVYALAFTTFELLIEQDPFSECRNINEIRKAIRNDEILNILAKNEDGISQPKKDLLKTALSSDRPSAADFLKKFNQITAAEN